MNVRKGHVRGKPVWWALYYDPARRQKPFPVPPDADPALDEEVRLRALHHAQERDTRVHPDQTWAAYLRYYAANLPDRMPDTTKGNRRAIYRACADLVPDVAVSEVTTDHLAVLYLALLKTNAYSRTTLSSHLDALMYCMTDAVMEGRLNANPFVAYYANPTNRIDRQPRDLDPPRVKLYARLRRRLDFHLLVYFTLIGGVGLSSTEAIALSWPQVDFDRNAISVEFTFRAAHGIGPCQLNRLRVIRDVRPSVMALLRIAKARGAGLSNDFVVNQVHSRGKPRTRQKLIPRCVAGLRDAQIAAGIRSTETGEPYLSTDFRNRWIIERINDGRRSFLHAQYEAGYANVEAFPNKFLTQVKPKDSAEQIARAVRAMEVLRGLDAT